MSNDKTAGRRGALTPVPNSPSVSEAEARAEWVSKALCRTTDPDELFVRGAAQRKVAEICRRCPVILECAADALDNHVEFGVWGGMTERERRALLQRNPNVRSWAEFFAAQRDRRTAAGDAGGASA